MPKKLTQTAILPLYRKFINEISKGKHVQKNGTRIKKASVRNYKRLELLLLRFSDKKNFNLRFNLNSKMTKGQFDAEKAYWKSFYIAFTGYLYDELKHHDNYVGKMLKLFRCFCNYLINEKGLPIGTFHRKLYSASEDIEIVALTPERLSILINNKVIEETLNDKDKKIKDVFVFGCAVSLRFSDLMSLRKTNVQMVGDRVYIKTSSQKTQTKTRVKLPNYALAILKKYKNQYTKRILPAFTLDQMNIRIKKVMEAYGFTEEITRTRNRRGIPESVYIISAGTKRNFRFCDAVSSHTMRRTAITTLLSLGLNEQIVRQISGLKPHSKEFYRYVSFSQTFIDTEVDKVYELFEMKQANLEQKSS